MKWSQSIFILKSFTLWFIVWLHFHFIATWRAISTFIALPSSSPLTVSIHVCSFLREKSVHESIYVIPISMRTAPITLEIDEYPFFLLHFPPHRHEPNLTQGHFRYENPWAIHDWRNAHLIKLTRPPPSIILNWSEIVLFPSLLCLRFDCSYMWNNFIIIHYHHHRITGKIHISLALPHICLCALYARGSHAWHD